MMIASYLVHAYPIRFVWFLVTASVQYSTIHPVFLSFDILLFLRPTRGLQLLWRDWEEESRTCRFCCLALLGVGFLS